MTKSDNTTQQISEKFTAPVTLRNPGPGSGPDDAPLPKAVWVEMTGKDGGPIRTEGDSLLESARKIAAMLAIAARRPKVA